MNANTCRSPLSWLDARLELEVRRWQIAGQNPNDRFRGLYISDTDALALTQRGAGGTSLPEEDERTLQQALERATERIREVEEQADAQNVRLRLKQLKEIFSLSDFEWWALIVCLAPGLDLRYERIYSYLQDDVTRTYASANLILGLLMPEGLARLDALNSFNPDAPLIYSRLLEAVEEPGKPFNRLRQAFQISDGLIDWLLGHYTTSAALAGRAELIFDEAADVETPARLPAASVLDSARPFISLQGGDALLKQLSARQVAASLGRALLLVRLSPDDQADSAIHIVSLAVRDARLQKALIYLSDCDTLIDGNGCLLTSIFNLLRQTGDCTLIGSQRPFKFNPDMAGNDYPLMHVPFTELSAAERADLWSSAVAGVDDNLLENEMSILAGQFNLSSGQIVAAASTAMSHALQEERSLEMVDLFSAARFHSEHHLDELTHKIEPRYSWEDLVVPKTATDMLKEMVDMVRLRPLVLDTWGLGRKLTAGAGISALFSGPPGTGKTLAAQIMANQLGIDLYRIDLSTMVSKYIGETEKNLEHIFTEASSSNAILFFDEADAIFGKRSEVKDAHDRYANIEVGYLLQRMESYSGVAILATNLRANLDEAFTRRLQFIINFPFPDEEYRLRIWKVLMPPDLPIVPDLDLPLMAKRFKLSGGNIRNIIVSAAYVAAADGGVVNMTHLLHGAKREIQKMGKLVQDADFVL